MTSVWPSIVVLGVIIAVVGYVIWRSEDALTVMMLLFFGCALIAGIMKKR